MAIFVFLQFLLLLALVVGAGLAALYAYRQLEWLDQEIRRVNIGSIGESQDLRRMIEELAAQVNSVEARLGSFHQHQSASVNFTQRSQAIRLIRKGETAESIARTLGLPRSQVNLLMKLQAQATRPESRSAQAAGGSQAR